MKKVTKNIWFKFHIVIKCIEAICLVRKHNFKNLVSTLKKIKPNKVKGIIDTHVLSKRIKKINKILFSNKCLINSIAIFTILKENGYFVEFKIGVKYDDGFKSHSWVECDGMPINEPNLDDYKIIHYIK